MELSSDRFMRPIVGKPLEPWEFEYIAIALGFRNGEECREFADEQQAKADYADFKARKMQEQNSFASRS